MQIAPSAIVFVYLNASKRFVRTVARRQGFQIVRDKEIAFSTGFINEKQLLDRAPPLMNIDYGALLVRVAEKRLVDCSAGLGLSSLAALFKRRKSRSKNSPDYPSQFRFCGP